MHHLHDIWLTQSTNCIAFAMTFYDFFKNIVLAFCSHLICKILLILYLYDGMRERGKLNNNSMYLHITKNEYTQMRV